MLLSPERASSILSNLMSPEHVPQAREVFLKPFPPFPMPGRFCGASPLDSRLVRQLEHQREHERDVLKADCFAREGYWAGEEDFFSKLGLNKPSKLVPLVREARFKEPGFFVQGDIPELRADSKKPLVGGLGECHQELVIATRVVSTSWTIGIASDSLCKDDFVAR
jgi:hypothetical protein